MQPANAGTIPLKLFNLMAFCSLSLEFCGSLSAVFHPDDVRVFENRQCDFKKNETSAVDFCLAARRTIEGEESMQYLLLIYDDEKRWEKLSKTQQDAETAEYGAFGKEFGTAIK